MLLVVEKGIRGGICYAIHQYTIANNKYMRNHNRDKESSYLIYWDIGMQTICKNGQCLKNYLVTI